MASQIELAGYAAMRFDYSGSGDSAGDESAVTLREWIDDIETAAGELQRVSGASQIVLVGLRAGGMLAAQAVKQGRIRCRHLVLWDPVVEGLCYLRELADGHRSYMREEMGPGEWVDDLQVDGRGIPRESLGMPFSMEFSDAVSRIDLASDPPRADHMTIISTSDSAPMSRLRAALAPITTARWIDIRDSSDWNSDSALNSATVPIEVVKRVVTRIQEVNP